MRMKIVQEMAIHCRRLQTLVEAGQGIGDVAPAKRTAAMWALLAGLVVFAGLQAMSGMGGIINVDSLPILQLMVGLLPMMGGALAGWFMLRLIFPGTGWRSLGMTASARLTSSRALKITLRLLLPVCLGCLAINLATYLLLRAGGLTYFPRQPLEILGQNAGVGYWLLAALMSIFLAPLAEEFVFRLLLYRTLQGTGLAYPGLVCSLIFAGVHMLPHGVPGLTFLALILQGSARRWGLRQAVFLHGSYNAVMFMLLVLQHYLQAPLPPG